MEATNSSPPRRITEASQFGCVKCHAVIFTETLSAELECCGAYKHSRVVVGSFTQATDAEGTPTGPVIPFCPTCEAKAHA